MALTTLDPKTALIVVDLQKGIVAMPVAHAMSDIVRRSAALAATFRKHKLPVVLVNAAGFPPGRTDQTRSLGQLPPNWTEFVPELSQQTSDHTVTKYTWGAFTRTDLDAYLKQAGVTQVVVCGVATSAGVESTARQAHELGYHVTLAIDAMTDRIPEAHVNSLTRIFPRMSETSNTQDIIDLLDKTR